MRIYYWEDQGLHWGLWCCVLEAPRGVLVESRWTKAVPIFFYVSLLVIKTGVQVER